MQRIHHTNNSEIKIPSPIRYREMEVTMKPNGLWYSIDWSWVDWCKDNTGWTHRNHFELEIDLTKVLLIDTGNKLKEFAKNFGEIPEWQKELANSDAMKKLWDNPKRDYINWKQVAEKYSGIEINPYHRMQRRDYLWVSGWDVSSGCIWNLELIKSVKQIEKNNYEKV